MSQVPFKFNHLERPELSINFNERSESVFYSQSAFYPVCSLHFTLTALEIVKSPKPVVISPFPVLSWRNIVTCWYTEFVVEEKKHLGFFMLKLLYIMI